MIFITLKIGERLDSEWMSVGQNGYNAHPRQSIKYHVYGSHFLLSVGDSKVLVKERGCG